MNITTFGNNKSDVVLAEHLTDNPNQASWACRAIGKTTSLLYDFEHTEFANKKFARTVFSLIRCSVLKHIADPPNYIDEKTKTYTANIISRHLTISFNKHFK